jgi:hypothetical protein
MMAKWELDCTGGSAVVVLQGPRDGEIRAINFIDGMTDDGHWIVRPVLQQFWDGRWSNIKVYQEDGDVLHGVKR